MSSPTQLPGAPIGPDAPLDATAFHFTRIPKLHELLDGSVGPKGGWPGCIYAQVCVHNLANARNRAEEPANLRPVRGSQYFSITGPRGTVNMALVATGDPIRGAAPEAGARLFFTDGEVEKLTGLPVGKFPIWLRPQPEEAPSGQEIHVTQSGDRSGEGSQGDARVQGGNPAQRKQQGSQGQKP